MIEELEKDDFYETEEDLGNQDYELYHSAVMWNTDWTTATIINQIDKENIDLNPSFQRRNAWDTKKKSKLIESLLLGIPIPPLILAETKNGNKTSYLVIDGKQRLLAIKQFYEDKPDSVYEPLKLTGLDILDRLNGKTITEIKNDAMVSFFLDNLDNQPIRTIIIRGWPNEEFLYTIFLRLNTGSLKLSPQELRQALHPGDFLKFVNDYTLSDNPIRRLLKLNKPDPRMRDVEFILRYYAFKNFYNKYDGKLKPFLDNTCKELNLQWKTDSEEIKQQLVELEVAINYSINIFGERNVFRVFNNNEYYSSLNRTIFDLFTIYFSKEENRNLLINKTEEIKEAFEKLMITDIKFREYTSVSTKNKARTEYRFSTFNKILDELKNAKK